MSTELRVRVYNVLFGDAILLSIPEVDNAGDPTIVHVLIDVGNALSGEGGRDEVLLPVLKNVRDVTGGQPLDLYLMTHEHMDHVQGLLHGASKLGIEFRARHLWMTASSEGEPYYARFKEARRKRLQLLDGYRQIAAFLGKGAAEVPAGLRALLDLNNPRATGDCVDYIRRRGVDGVEPRYVHRNSVVAGHHPFRRTKIRLLAPEENTAEYYGALPPRTLGPFVAGRGGASFDPASVKTPVGVDPLALLELLAFRASGMAGNLRAIDRAANNSSVAFELEWNGWRLLFPADAEERSWELMDRRTELRPVHFLKVVKRRAILPPNRRPILTP